jgi:hypothetical protein
MASAGGAVPGGGRLLVALERFDWYKWKRTTAVAKDDVPLITV